MLREYQLRGTDFRFWAERLTGPSSVPTVYGHVVGDKGHLMVYREKPEDLSEDPTVAPQPVQAFLLPEFFLGEDVLEELEPEEEQPE